MNLHLPTWATTIVALIAGALEVVNELALPIGPQWHAYITVGLTFIAGLGISPLVGIAFRNALHLPQSVSVAISSVLAALTLALTQLDVSAGWKSIIGFVLMFFSGIGFGPAWGGTVSKAQALAS